MSERDDPLEELKGLWGRLDGEDAEELPEADAVDAEVLDWMRSAWTHLEVPEVVVPRRGRLHRWRRWSAVAAALLLAFLVREGLHSSGEAPSVDEAPPHAKEQLAAGGRSSEESVPPRPTLRPDGWELRSGPVKLVMVSPAPMEGTQ